MTYIKWKDEVESYLVNLPQEEKQKIFSYFSEMYADKRDAGKSEAQIIEEFGAPYDVAKKILAESRDAAAPQSEQTDGVRTANAANVNVNINVNGGAGAQQGSPYQNGVPSSYIPSEKPAAKSSGKTVGAIIAIIILIALNVGLALTAATGMFQGFVEIGAALGAIAAGKCSAGEAITDAGLGLLNVGGSLLLLAGVIALGGTIKKKIKAYKGVK